jgi:hypothetical protein
MSGNARDRRRARRRRERFQTWLRGLSIRFTVIDESPFDDSAIADGIARAFSTASGIPLHLMYPDEPQGLNR